MFTSMLFPNLAVKDLKKTMDFFSALGFTFEPKFTDDKAACLKINDQAFVMLLTEPFFQSFYKKPIADAAKSNEVLLAVSLESKAKVDEVADKAVSMGATEARKEDMGFIYTRAISDLDGHIWEFFWMDPKAV